MKPAVPPSRPARARARRPAAAQAAPLPQPPAAADNTPERLLRAARQCLLAKGLSGFKVLEVAAQAEANVALINYHFGSREGLLVAVFARAGEEVAALRAHAFEVLHADPAAPPTLELLVRTWLRPVLQEAREGTGALLIQLVQQLFISDLSETRKLVMVEATLHEDARWLDAFARHLPALSRPELAWRLFGAIGAFCFMLARPEPVGWRHLAGGDAALASREAAFEVLVAFVVGGLSAPAARALAG